MQFSSKVRVCMECQYLLSGKTKNNISKCHLLLIKFNLQVKGFIKMFYPTVYQFSFSNNILTNNFAAQIRFR